MAAPMVPVSELASRAVEVCLDCEQVAREAYILQRPPCRDDPIKIGHCWVCGKASRQGRLWINAGCRRKRDPMPDMEDLPDGYHVWHEG